MARFDPSTTLGASARDLLWGVWGGRRPELDEGRQVRMARFDPSTTLGLNAPSGVPRGQTAKGGAGWLSAPDHPAGGVPL